MPSVIHKQPIREEQLKTLPEACRDLMWSKDPWSKTPGDTIYHLFGIVSGSLELAYLRGYELGFEAGKKSKADTKRGKGRTSMGKDERANSGKTPKRSKRARSLKTPTGNERANKPKSPKRP